MPTLGFAIGTTNGDVVYNRHQNLRQDADIFQQMTDYYADKMRRIARGEPIQVHPFRTHAAALANYEAWVRERVPVQMEVMAAAKEKNPDQTNIIVIPKLYKVKGGMTKDDAAKVAALSDEGKTLDLWIDGLGYVFTTSAVYAPKKDIVMYVAILVPKE